MKVILIDEIRGLGSRGDVVTVKDGYARNFLLPKQLAREATPGNLKSVEQERKKWALLADKEKVVAQKAAESVKGTKIVVRKRVGDHGNLFGSVTTNDIADALTAKGIEIDKRRIELAHPIKSIGTHDVEVRLHREVTAHIQVEVVPEGKESIIEEAPAPKAAAAPAAEAEA
ncbi:MAG TPA: 50S ribosomal protein L9 [Thermoanaerobaculia bacterium]|jgi:large subunit ribosomal protein L9|nr:50S ribosomal protein L9 [Thermoanaerobaculia bacterium]